MHHRAHFKAATLAVTSSLSMLACVGAPVTNNFRHPQGVRPELYHADWIDFNKNGRKDIFEDATQPTDLRVEDLLAQMNVEEKTCQLATLYGYQHVLKDPLPTPAWKNEIWKDGIANIDEMHNGVVHFGAGANPHLASPAATVRALNEVQRWFIEETRLGIPVEFTDEGIRGACYPKTVNFAATLVYDAPHDTARNRIVDGDAGRELLRANKGAGGIYLVTLGKQTYTNTVRQGINVRQALGNVSLTPGEQTLQVTATEIVGEELFRLRRLELKPVSD